MRVTGLFFVPASSPDSSPAQDLIYRLNSAFEATQIAQWALSYHLFREIPHSAQTATNLGGPEKNKITGRQRIMQVLSLSHHIPKTYVVIAAPQAPTQTRVGTPVPVQVNGEVAGFREPPTIISIPSGGPKEEFVQLIASKFGPLWQFRQILHVAHGATFEVGDFKIRIGDLKPGSASGTGTQKSRGAICEVEWIDPESPQLDHAAGSQGRHWRDAEPIIKGFWNSLEVKGAKEVLSAPDLKDELGGTVRQWFEILPQRLQ